MVLPDEVGRGLRPGQGRGSHQDRVTDRARAQVVRVPGDPCPHPGGPVRVQIIPWGRSPIPAWLQLQGGEGRTQQCPRWPHSLNPKSIPAWAPCASLSPWVRDRREVRVLHGVLRPLVPGTPHSWIIDSTGHNGSIYRGQYGRL